MSCVWVYLYVLQSWLCVCVHLCLDCPFCINLCLYIVLCLSLHVSISVKLCLCICLWIGMCGMCLRFCKLARHPSEKKRQTTLVSDQVIMLTKWGGKANSICCAALWWGMKHRNIKMRIVDYTDTNKHIQQQPDARHASNTETTNTHNVFIQLPRRYHKFCAFICVQK